MAGGIAGVTVQQSMRFGVARGLFSNEAGLGSTPHAHALAEVKDPHEQGVVAMIGVFVDTIIVCTMTGLTILCSGLWNVEGALSGAPLTAAAFESALPGIGSIMVSICLAMFAFSTILSWNLFGKINANYLFGRKNSKLCSVIYTIIALVFIFLGTLTSSDLVWELSDMFNNLMVIPNAIALFALTGLVVKHVNGTPEADRWE